MGTDMAKLLSVRQLALALVCASGPHALECAASFPTSAGGGDHDRDVRVCVPVHRIQFFECSRMGYRLLDGQPRNSSFCAAAGVLSVLSVAREPRIDDSTDDRMSALTADAGRASANALTS